MPDKAVEETLWAYRDRMVDLKNDRRFRYVLLFKNHGEPAGASLEHTHSQLIALPIVPKRVREEVDNSKRYYNEKERCIFCDMIRQEMETEKRVILENDQFHCARSLCAAFSVRDLDFAAAAQLGLRKYAEPASMAAWRDCCANFLCGSTRCFRAFLQLRRPHVADRRRNQRSLPLAHRDDAQADEGGGI